MIEIKKNKDMGGAEYDWLKSSFHFSFDQYYNPNNMNYGALRVVNDDLIQPHTGFDTHPHRDMEIVTYVIDGKLTHGDSMGNSHTLTRGQVQYMSAGTGVFHSEHNLSDEVLRLLQIWILPDKKGYNPNYGDYAYPWEEREGKWLNIVSGELGNARIHIHQDMNISVASLDALESIDWKGHEGRKQYLIQIEGRGNVNGYPLEAKDAAQIMDEDIHIVAVEPSHYMILDMQA